MKSSKIYTIFNCLQLEPVKNDYMFSCILGMLVW